MLFWLKSDLARQVEKDPSLFANEKFQSELSQVEHHYVQAAANHKMGELKRAQAYLQKGLQHQLHHVSSLYAMALLSFEMRQWEKAKKWFLRAIRVDENAADNVLYMQKRLRILLDLPTATHWASWCLKQLEEHKKASESSLFELGKTLFEQSQFAEAVPYLKKVVQKEEYSFEATQYLSYIYEHLYKGDDLIEKTLELATQTDNRADLFFNLAMVCQHEQKRPDLSLHFFYLASTADPEDPGLKFSLEQSALEVIGELSDAKTPEEFATLMLAHFHQGSLAVAQRYALILKERFGWDFPESFRELAPRKVWVDWLLDHDTSLMSSLETWFAEEVSAEAVSSKDFVND